MSLFSKKDKKEEEKKEIASSSGKAVEKEEKVKESKTKKNDSIKDAAYGYGVLLEPWITEKSHEGMADNKYIFKVSGKSSKIDVKKAVEGMYGVTVEKVAVINTYAKKKRFGRYEGTRSSFKKAIVTLKKGDSIQVFEGA